MEEDTWCLVLPSMWRMICCTVVSIHTTQLLTTSKERKIKRAKILCDYLWLNENYAGPGTMHPCPSGKWVMWLCVSDALSVLGFILLFLWFLIGFLEAGKVVSLDGTSPDRSKWLLGVGRWLHSLTRPVSLRPAGFELGVCSAAPMSTHLSVSFSQSDALSYSSRVWKNT